MVSTVSINEIDAFVNQHRHIILGQLLFFQRWPVVVRNLLNYVSPNLFEIDPN